MYAAKVSQKADAKSKAKRKVIEAREMQGTWERDCIWGNTHDLRQVLHSAPGHGSSDQAKVRDHPTAKLKPGEAEEEYLGEGLRDYK